MTWHPTGVAFEALAPGALREVVVGESTIVLVRAGNAVSAIDAVCPHRGGFLSDGTLDGVRLQCPVHGAIFDVRTGGVLADPFGIEPPEGDVEPVRGYPARVVAGMIEVDLP